MRETTVEKHLRKQATAAGALVRKMIWPGHRGAPDRLVIWPGFRLSADPNQSHADRPDVARYLLQAQQVIAAEMPGTAIVHFVELKAPGKKLDPHQEREHERLRAAGCTVIVLDSIEAVDKYIAQRTS